MMVVIFIVTYLLSIVNMFYTALWYIYRKRKNKVVNAEDDYPVYKQDVKSKPKDDVKKTKPGKSYDDSIPTWRYTPESG